MKRDLRTLIPEHIRHIQRNAKGFNPENNEVELDNGEKVGYDYLVVAAGISSSE